MITEIIKEAKLTGAKDERLPYPIGNDPLSKADSATEEHKFECSKYPYRRVVGRAHNDRHHVCTERAIKVR